MINNPIKVVKMKDVIEISRVMITLAIEKETRTMNDVITICIIDNQIKLNLAQTENRNKMNISIIISHDKIVSNISSITDEYQKDISEVINCSSNIRYTLLKNIMYCIIKICDKKTMKLIRKKGVIKKLSYVLERVGTAKISKAWVG